MPVPIFSKTLLSLTTLLAASYPIANENFYKKVVQDTSQNVPGKKTHSKLLDPVDAFTQQGFLLWDYLVGVNADSDCVDHFNNLITLCQTRNIQKVILFIPSPDKADSSIKFNFFQAHSSMPDNFITMTQRLVHTMRTVANVPNFEVSLLFETGTFISDITETPSFVNPYTEIAAELPSDHHVGYFANITNMLNWSAFMIGQPGIGITEITFDPEGSGSDGVKATKSDQQTVYNYSDNYKYAYGLTYTPYGTSTPIPIKLGTTIGIDESKIAFANLSTFPVNSIFPFSFSDTFPNPTPSWRLINTELPDKTVPLLQSIYIQLYQTNIPAMFAAGATSSGSHNGNLAATYFNSLLRDQPYIAGLGRISCTLNNIDVTGISGSQFSSMQGEEPFLFTTATPPKKIGIVETIVSDTNLTLSDGATITANNITYQRTEIAPGWTTQPGITQDMVNRIYWMLALNYEVVSPHPPAPPYRFFGNWNLSDFMSFITSVNQVNAANPPFLGLTFPAHNYVIYELSLLADPVNTIPVPPWNVYEPTLD